MKEINLICGTNIIGVPKNKLFLGISIALLVNLLQAFFTPITEDEAYYWLWSQNLDWGYFDHPPMVAWWISAGYALMQNELGTRLLTIVLNGFSFFFLWKILAPKSPQQGNLFWAIFGSVLVIQVFGFLITPDAPLLFSTLFYLFGLKGFLDKNRMLDVLWLAISFAGLMYSKYHGILVILFTLLPIWKTWWKNPKFYLSVLGSLVFYAPHLMWLFQHEFSPIQYHFLERSADESFELRKLTNYFGMVLLGCSPFLSYFIWKANWKFQSQSAFEKSIWCLGIFPMIFFFFTIFKDNVQPQWLLISFLGMAIVTYLFYAEKGNLKWLIRLGFLGIILVIGFRIFLMIPAISPLAKYENFGKEAGNFSLEHAIFEKYQEASLYKFYHPERKVAVHRTLGNRKSQFNLWGWEENYYNQKVEYVSPWVKAENSFVGFKKRDYFIKEIPNYLTFDLVEIESEKFLQSKPSAIIEIPLKIRNNHTHPITIGQDSELILNINFYQGLQYEILYGTDIETKKFTLNPCEEKEFSIRFKNFDKKGNYKACLGLRYAPIGTTYLSKPIEIQID